MGEHKLPKTPPPAPVRPVMAILRMAATVQGFFQAEPEGTDEDTRQYMRDLRACMEWIEHLDQDGGPSREAAVNRALGLSVPRGDK